MIKPTKRAWLVLELTAISLAVAWVSELFWAYLVSALCIGTVVVCGVVATALRFGVRLSRGMPRAAYEKDDVRVALRIDSRRNFFQAMELCDLFPAAGPERQEQAVWVHGGAGESVVHYSVRCVYRGNYRIGPVRMRVFDPLGLFYAQQEFPLYSRLTVYPERVAVRRLPFLLGTQSPRYGPRTTRISGEYEEFYGVRDYRQEDGLRRIHWPISARRRELTVRHYEQSSQWRAVVILDACRAENRGYDRDCSFEYLVKIAAALLHYLSRSNAEYGLVVSSRTLIRYDLNRSREHFLHLLSDLSSVQPDGEEPLQRVLMQQECILPSLATVFLLTGQSSPSLIQLSQVLQFRKGISIVPVVVDSGSFLGAESGTERLRQAVARQWARITDTVYVIRRGDRLAEHFL